MRAWTEHDEAWAQSGEPEDARGYRSGVEHEADRVVETIRAVCRDMSINPEAPIVLEFIRRIELGRPEGDHA